ncbi:MAG TPA: YciI family protein [Burkholderiaceae bacterium]
MFIILLHYIKPLEEVERHLPAHRAFLEKHYADGHFIVSGRRVPRTGGVIIAKAAGREQVNDLIAGDPFYRHEVAEYDIVEFEPTMSDGRFDLAP